MSPRVTPKFNRLALVVGRAVAATNATYANRLCTINRQVDRLTVRQIGEIGQHLRNWLRVEPLKVLVISLDEYGPAGRRTLQERPRAVDIEAVVAIDLRVLRWCLIPAALLVCVTIVLWQLRAHDVPPAVPGHGVTVSSSAAFTHTPPRDAL